MFGYCRFLTFQLWSEASEFIFYVCETPSQLILQTEKKMKLREHLKGEKLQAEIFMCIHKWKKFEIQIFSQQNPQFCLPATFGLRVSPVTDLCTRCNRSDLSSDLTFF